MAVTTLTPAEFHEHHRRWEHAALTTELLLALGAVVLAIIGLVRVLPNYLAAIATIGLGVMLLFEGASVVFRSCAVSGREPLAAGPLGRSQATQYTQWQATMNTGCLT